MIVQTAAFATAWLALHRYVTTHGPIPSARRLIFLNSWIYSAASLILLILICLPQHEDLARYLYHASKFYEYVDILGVRASGGDIDLHFGVHHLTTPYVTYVRVLHHSDGWWIVGALNALHHAFMYAYFGGAQSLRAVLPVTGTAQLVVGLVGESWVLWRKRENGEMPQWPHVFVLVLLTVYFVLWVRDLKARSKMQAEKTPKTKDS